MQHHLKWSKYHKIQNVKKGLMAVCRYIENLWRKAQCSWEKENFPQLSAKFQRRGKTTKNFWWSTKKLKMTTSSACLWNKISSEIHAALNLMMFWKALKIWLWGGVRGPLLLVTICTCFVFGLPSWLFCSYFCSCCDLTVCCFLCYLLLRATPTWLELDSIKLNI